MPFGSSYISYLISGIISIVIIIIVCITLIHSYIKSKNSSTIFYIFFFVMLGVWAFGTTFYPIMDTIDSAFLFQITGVIFVYFGFYSLFIFLELINYDKINVVRAVLFASVIIIFLVLIAVASSLLIKYEYLLNFGFTNKPSYLASILQGILLIGIGIEYVYTAYRLKKIAETPAQKQQAIWFMAGPAIGIFGVALIPIFRLIIDFPGFLLLFSSIGMALSGMAFIKDPNVAFFLPFRVYNLMVIDTAGINIFHQKFGGYKDVNEVLVSGMITGITSFMEEALGVKSQLRAIIFGDRYVLLDLREKFGVFIDSETASKTLKIALEKFADYFESEFSEHLNKSTKNINVYKSAINGVEKYFGFLPGAWKSH
ncbi:MAG: hypothetical protein ACFFDN_14345 [Candidatus Hodarchaeota archaeon]